MVVYAVVDMTLSATSPLGDAIDTFIRREDAERFVEEVRGDDPGEPLRIEERELEAGGLNYAGVRARDSCFHAIASLSAPSAEIPSAALHVSKGTLH